VDPVTDTLLLRESGSVGNRTRTSGSVRVGIVLTIKKSYYYVTLLVRINMRLQNETSHFELLPRSVTVALV
jgi:hypothetical protein